MDPMAIIMAVFRMIPPLIFILFIILLFFSLKVSVIGEDLQRFNLELSDVLAGSPLALHRSVFSVSEMNKAETSKELYARSCDYGYTLELSSIGTKTICENDVSVCKEFCKEVCNIDDLQMSGLGTLTGNCGCNIELFGQNFCECVKNGEWISGYHWKFGYTPNSRTSITKFESVFPVGIATVSGVHETTIPAKLTLTVHDSLLTRLACITQKAYETQSRFSLQLSASNMLYFGTHPSVIFEREDDNTACLYQRDQTSLDYQPVDCRKLDIPFESLNVIFDGSVKGNIVAAYPVKYDTDCETIKKNPDAITEPGDTVATVLLCVE